MFNANLVPGSGFQKFTICNKKSSLSSSGTPITQGYEETKDVFWGIPAIASQREIAEWKQNQHPITHTVVQYGTGVQAKATDYIVADDGRKFYIQGVDNAGNLGVAMIYYVEERFDIK